MTDRQLAPPLAAPPPAADGPPAPSPECAAEAARPSWRSDELLGGQTEITILHGNEVYRLRRTKQGKLILYK